MQNHQLTQLRRDDFAEALAGKQWMGGFGQAAKSKRDRARQAALWERKLVDAPHKSIRPSPLTTR